MNPSPESTSLVNVFVDANVVLEVLFGRRKDAAAREALKQYAGRLHISALTAHLVTHFGQQIVTLPVLRQFLSDYIIIGLESMDFEWAFTHIRNKDFEDALQLAGAIRYGCDSFITLDATLYKTYLDLPSIEVALI